MKTERAASQLELRATEALRALLGQVSAIKLKEMKRESQGNGRGAEILVHIDVYGHSHTLACEVKAKADLSNLGDVLTDLHQCNAHFAGDATPVLIAPYLSPEAQALCNERHAAFLDLEGNARLAIGEVFIGKRTFAHRHTQPSALAALAGFAPHSVSTSRDSAGTVAVA